jgi:p-cumate 2,3-dioxygenase beta subunit
MIGRAEIEDFLYAEAALLDDDRFDDWLALWTDDGHYIVPALDGGTLTLISDDHAQLRTRAKQLASGTTWAEVPRSKTQRMVSNVRITAHDEARVAVVSKFLVHRFRRDRADAFAGTYHHELVRSPDRLRIREKRCVLAHDSLLAQGSVSIIL